MAVEDPSKWFQCLFIPFFGSKGLEDFNLKCLKINLWILSLNYPPGSTNIAMENPPFEDVFPIGKGEFPLPC